MGVVMIWLRGTLVLFFLLFSACSYIPLKFAKNRADLKEKFGSVEKKKKVVIKTKKKKKKVARGVKSRDEIDIEDIAFADELKTKEPRWSDDDFEFLESHDTPRGNKYQVQKWPASQVFVAGYNDFAKNCNLRLKPSLKGKIIGRVTRGDRLWVDDHSAKWAKIRRQRKTVFVSKICL